jgi:hypothetical protein
MSQIASNGPRARATDRSGFAVLIDLLNQLDVDKISHRLSHQREEAVMIEAAVPGERWEIEVFEDGHIEFERFRSTGHIGDADELTAALAQLR